LLVSALDLISRGEDDDPHDVVVLLADRSGLDGPVRAE
jgi:hypothetical protein